MRAVLLDTDVFSALYITDREQAVRRGYPVDAWESALVGLRLLISFQTRAEVLSGAYIAGWGERRLATVLSLLDSTPTIEVDRGVVEAYAVLVSEAQRSGHPFGNPKEHVADRWIAACAIAKDLSLLTGNLRHFAQAPGLRLLDAPDS